MIIFITGAFGFVGTNLSKSFSSSSTHQLVALDISAPEKHQFHEFYTWNDLDKINWESIDVIIHLAGKAHDTQNTSSEQSYFDINLGLTQKIFEYFLKSGAKKFIFFSSVKAVADSVKGDILTEKDVPTPGTPYGKSKLAAEEYLADSLQQYNKEQEGDTPKMVYVFRPAMIHGPGNKGNLNLLYKLVSKGIPWPLGAFENKRSFTSIDNLAFVIHQIREKNIAPGVYQMADDHPISTNKLIELIAASKNNKAKIWRINPKLISFVARMGGVLYLPLNPERLQKLTESYVVSNQKLKRALGIEAMPVSADEGMRKTLESFK